ncbi:MAG: bifunctional oligoribonuclease/PAP phosphatase NrnA [Anaerolineales bacterium]|nr:bifunctional oligoribonuclease/PAP phosphatase NrnA [Anaerolineales bacterium]
MNNLIRQEISKAQKVLLVSHIRPDGDAIGSLIGLGLALEAAGKNVNLVSIDGAPSSLKFLPGYQKINQSVEDGFDLLIVVDCSDWQRTGLATKIEDKPGINIDHHITNDHFARINWVDTTAAATAEIIAENITSWGLELNQEIARALLTAIITDTIGFRTSNVSPRTLRIAADLLSSGISINEIYMQALVNRSLEAMRYWGAGLNKLQKEDGMVWTSLTLDDQNKTGYYGKDDADLINIISGIEGIPISIIFIEQPGGGVKVSWRAQPGYDVSRVAQEFGGGGHPAAAGAMFDSGLKEVQEIVIRNTRKLLNNYKSS